MKLKPLYLLVLLLITTTSFATTNPTEEDQEKRMKSHFILSITKYLEWSEGNHELTLGVISNNDEMYNIMTSLASARKSSKKITVKNYSNLSEIEGCNILFITKEGGLSANQIQQLDNKNLLVITEDDEISSSGSINLVKVDGKLMFEINRDMVNKTGIKMASRLMDLAIVK